MPIQLNDDTIEILSSDSTIMHIIDKSSYDDTDVISLLSTSNITFLGGEVLNVDGNINYTGTLTKEGIEFSSYDDTDVISLLSSNNINFLGEGGLDVVGNINISTGSKYQVNGSNLSFDEVDGVLTLAKGGTGITNIEDFKALLGIGGTSSEYEITEISPVFFNLTTGTGETTNVDDYDIGIETIDNVDYVKPMTFTIYGKNFDRNIKVDFIDIKNDIYSNFVNTIYYDSPVKIRVVTRYINKDILLGNILLGESDKFPYKIKIYNKDIISKYYLSPIDINRDENSPMWNINQDFVKILDKGNNIGCDFSLTDSDDLSSNYISYSIEEGITLPADLFLDSSTGHIISSNFIEDYTSNLVPSNTILTIKAVSGAVEMERTGNFYILGGPDWITSDEVILSILSDNTFTLEAVSQADSIINEVTNITYSMIDESQSEITEIILDGTDKISLSGNTINLTDLDLLGETGRDITVQATDGYGYSSTKTINIKKRSGYHMYGTGRNYYGELINNFSSVGASNNNMPTPELIEWFIERSITITHFALGDHLTMFVTDEGYVYGCGNNDSGQLGINNKTSQPSPVLVQNFRNSSSSDTTISNSSINIKNVFAGYNQTYFLTDEGKVYSCGKNDKGQLGLGSVDTTKQIPVLVEKYYYNETQYYNHTQIIIKQVATGMGKHALFLTKYGEVYSVGRNIYGQLGLGSANPDESSNKIYPNLITEFRSYNDDDTYETKNHNELSIKQVSVGAYYSVVLTEDGKVYTFGYNGDGRLGLASDYIGTQPYPRLVNKFHDPDVTPDYTSDTITIKHISSYNDFTMFLTNNGEVYSCGSNEFGQLGIINNDNTNRYTPYLIQKYDIWDDDTFLESIDHTNVKILKTSCGERHTIFLTEDGKVYSCGTAQYSGGSLGLGINSNNGSRWIPTSVSEMDYFSNTEIKDIATGNMHTIFASYKTNSVFATGYDGYFQLGDDAIIGNKSSMILSTLIMKPGINVKSISCGENYTMYLTESGSVYGVGRNNYGQFGINNMETYVRTPQLVEYFEANGDTLKGGRGVDSEKIIIKQVLANEYTTYFLTNEGKVYSCGNNSYGQLGIKDDDALIGKYKKPQLIEYFEENGDITKGGRGTPSAKIIIDKVIGGSGEYIIFIDNNDGIYGVGKNNYQQFVFGDNSQSKYNTPQEIIHFTTNSINIKQVGCGSHHNVFLTDNGSVYSVGRNDKGQLGLGDKNDRNVPELIDYFEAGGRGEGSLKITIEEIFSNVHCTFCRTSDGKVYGCGYNNYGQLGLSDTTDKDTPQMISYINNITQIVSSGYHTVFVINDYNVVSFGKNNNGQLGLGYTSTYNTTIQEITSLRNSNIIQIDFGYEFTTFLTEKHYNNTSPQPLYDFTSHSFTNAGASGRYGPTLSQCHSSYSSSLWALNTNFFNMTTQGVQLWTVPKNGNYTIYCYGARGGDTPPPPESTSTTTQLGGKGASVSETFYLFKNQVLSIVVGQQGGTSTGTIIYPLNNIAGGGGGGSFVYSGDLLYCAAGGGSGAAHINATHIRYYEGRDGSVDAESNNITSETRGSDFVGQGGQSGHWWGGGNGAGWLSDGLSSENDGTNTTSGKIEGRSRPSWVGGEEIMYIPSYESQMPQIGGWGGFGGGGGVMVESQYGIPGAGGGYSGGFSYYAYNNPGGGGGSYFSSNGSYNGVNNSPGGYVNIHFIS